MKYADRVFIFLLLHTHLFRSKICLLVFIFLLVQEPRHFRCGFDIVLPFYPHSSNIPTRLEYQYNGGSIIRIKNFDMHVDLVGFYFSVQFEVRYPMPNSASSQQPFPLPYPFYLSFESEHTEERFDAPLNLERNMVDGRKYLWTINISREHCHFVKTEAHITFKVRQGLIIREWGLCMLTKKYIDASDWSRLLLKRKGTVTRGTRLQIEEVGVSSNNNSIGPKFQLPYNWLVSTQEDVENDEVIDISSLFININQWKDYSPYSSFSILNSTNTIHHFKVISKQSSLSKKSSHRMYIHIQFSPHYYYQNSYHQIDSPSV